MSGYMIKITAFLPCGKGNDAHVYAGGCIAEVREALERVGCEEIDLRDEFKPNRKSVPAPVTPATAEPAAQEPVVEVAPAASAAGDPLDIPEGLRRGLPLR